MTKIINEWKEVAAVNTVVAVTITQSVTAEAAFPAEAAVMAMSKVEFQFIQLLMSQLL